jgi:murein DD-endopeptidase MepM/ murein hydrolase activator NlpD
MAVNFAAFPVAGWESYDPIAKPRAPGKTCPRMSFINDYKAKRGNYYHHAIDIFASPGSHAIAVDNGVMWQHKDDPRGNFSYWKSGGWHAYLLSDQGYIYYYAHLLDHPVVRPGQRVRAGQFIGQVGQSGNADKTCPHLHFAAYVASEAGNKGRVVNPYERLRETRRHANPVVPRLGGAFAIAALLLFL